MGQYNTDQLTVVVLALLGNEKSKGTGREGGETPHGIPTKIALSLTSSSFPSSFPSSCFD